MKKLNKKGFTLAELLIVIAIIAILIAIAIPVFAGQLDNAKLQTDHANIRSAYAIYQTAQLEGGLYLGTGTTFTKPSGTNTYYFHADGSLSDDTTNLYVLKANGDKNKCAASAGCGLAKTTEVGDTHKTGKVISIVFTKGTGSAADKWEFKFVDEPAAGSP